MNTERSSTGGRAEVNNAAATSSPASTEAEQNSSQSSLEDAVAAELLQSTEMELSDAMSSRPVDTRAGDSGSVSADSKLAGSSSSAGSDKDAPRSGSLARKVALYKAMVVVEFLKSDSEPVEVLDGLYIGSVGAAFHREHLQLTGITHILSALKGVKPRFPDQFSYCVLELLDSAKQDLLSHLPTALSFIDGALKVNSAGYGDGADASLARQLLPHGAPPHSTAAATAAAAGDPTSDASSSSAVHANSFVGSITGGGANSLSMDTQPVSAAHAVLSSISAADSNLVPLQAPPQQQQPAVSAGVTTTRTLLLHPVRPKPPRVLVHCFRGSSRSGAVVIAYVMRRRRMTFVEALRFVQSRRSIVNPNPGFVQQLLQYEKQLFGDGAASALQTTLPAVQST